MKGRQVKVRRAARRRRCANCGRWIRKGECYVLQLQLLGGPAKPIHLRQCPEPNAD